MRKLIYILLLFAASLQAQEIYVFSESDANALRGTYGNYSGLDPIPLPDGTWALPKRVIFDNDLQAAFDLIHATKQDSSEILKIPEVGQQVVEGYLYKYADETGHIDSMKSRLVKCIQTHNRTIYPPYETPALFSFFRINSDTLTWIENEYVYLGWKRVYDGTTYEVIQEHMTLVGWEPQNVPTLWQAETPPTSDWSAGVSYSVDDVVNYLGTTYICLQAHTSIVGWEPPNVPALWQAQ